MNAIRPISVTADKVTLRRSDYERLLDAADLAHARTIEAKAVRGETEYLPAALVRRMAQGEVPVAVWRAHRGFSQRVLAERAKLSGSYLCEIETGVKPGSVAALNKLARALSVSIDDLI